jgi:hypothetical protein
MEPSARLLRKFQKNDIFDAIQTAGLKPVEFDIVDGESEFRVKHRWSDSYLTISGKPSKYTVRHRVGDESEWQIDKYSWVGVMQSVPTWLAQVKMDLKTPDLWSDLQGEAKLLGTVSNEAIENTPFTSDEREVIALRLREMVEGKRPHSLHLNIVPPPGLAASPRVWCRVS